MVDPVAVKPQKYNWPKLLFDSYGQLSHTISVAAGTDLNGGK